MMKRLGALFIVPALILLMWGLSRLFGIAWWQTLLGYIVLIAATGTIHGYLRARQIAAGWTSKEP
jgi:hypothetical protein